MNEKGKTVVLMKGCMNRRHPQDTGISQEKEGTVHCADNSTEMILYHLKRVGKVI